MMSRGPQLQVLSREKRIPRKTFLDGRLLLEMIIKSSVLSWAQNFFKTLPVGVDTKRNSAL
jgi:hypothetical protein